MWGISEEMPDLGTKDSREGFLEEMSELRPKGPIGIRQEEEEEQSKKREQPVQGPQPYPHGLLVQ